MKTFQSKNFQQPDTSTIFDFVETRRNMLQLYPQYAFDRNDGKEIEMNESIDNACKMLHDACAGFGTDEEKLNEVLGPKSVEERYLIAIRYEEMFKKSLRKLMKSETSGDYGRLLQLTCLPIDEAEAQIIRHATKGFGTTEKLLYPVLLGRSNKEIDLLKKAFYRMFEKDLTVTLDSELSGDLKKLYMTAMQELAVPFDESVHTNAKAEEIADSIYDAGQGRWGTDEVGFFKLIFSTPPEFLHTVDEVYAKKHGYTLEKAIEKEFGGKVREALKHALGMILKPYETVADLFEKTMKGLGTDEYGLTAAMIRYQRVLPQVKEAYEKKYNRTLRDRIHGEVSGKFRSLLLDMCNHAC